MNMVRLNLNLLVFILTTTISFYAYGQNNVNLIIFINDEIVTSSLGLTFNNNISQREYKVSYYPGKEIETVNNDIFKEDVFLKFNYQGFDENRKIKSYNYNIPLVKGLFYDTNYLIVKIYNLDIKRYKKRYCKFKDDYVVEFKNRRYYQDIVQCK
ncbi:hypothetical protein VUJ46_05075 [Chryseobacterium sp. MYb264]|uniref:hypothetical protein n=1 Tax=Chryseobacterium sp. MYb264 TaxID=2745153 RepID=UPI002E0E70FE|nr:hypothetical protein VUJ46_05075 [Chryseobacterium sp. MYb264]